jgi:methionyl-tRNA formyltransferase
MEIVFLGINDTGWEIYEWLCGQTKAEVTGLVTTKQQLSLVEALEPDLVVSVGYQYIVPKEILSIPTEGCINLHPGYLPHTRGFNPNVWSIIEGHPPGVTIHYMKPEVDTGEIIAQRRVESSFADTGKSLYQRLEDASTQLFKETWPAIRDGTVDTSEQEEGVSSIHYKSDFEDLCNIDPEETYEAKELIDILRALTFPPFDNAFIEIDGEKHYIEVEITPESRVDDVDRAGNISSY